jgi:hypothetical protein
MNCCIMKSEQCNISWVTDGGKQSLEIVPQMFSQAASCCARLGWLSCCAYPAWQARYFDYCSTSLAQCLHISPLYTLCRLQNRSMSFDDAVTWITAVDYACKTCYNGPIKAWWWSAHGICVENRELLAALTKATRLFLYAAGATYCIQYVSKPIHA